MTPAAVEQWNPYKGSPLRPWLRLRLCASDGSMEELELLADTGNPCAIICRLVAYGGDADGFWIRPVNRQS